MLFPFISSSCYRRGVLEPVYRNRNAGSYVLCHRKWLMSFNLNQYHSTSITWIAKSHSPYACKTWSVCPGQNPVSCLWMTVQCQYAHCYCLQVSTNGLVSVDVPVQDYRPRLFPTNDILVAPFWADVDTSNDTGIVSFGVTNSRTQLSRAEGQIAAAFPDVVFKITLVYLFVATWDSVGYYRRKTDLVRSPKNKYNFTSPAVLIAVLSPARTCCCHSTQ